jgi:hypothetical protein
MTSSRDPINYRASSSTEERLKKASIKLGISKSLFAKRLAILSMYELDSRFYNLVSRLSESKIRDSGKAKSFANADSFEECCHHIQSTIRFLEEMGHKIYDENQRCGFIVSIVRTTCKLYGDDVKNFELQFMGVSQSENLLIETAVLNRPTDRMPLNLDPKKENVHVHYKKRINKASKNIK